MSVPRPVVVGLVLVVAAFVAATAAGALRSDRRLAVDGIDAPGWLVGLGVRGEVGPADLTVVSGCEVDGRRIRFGGRCELRLDRGGGARHLRLVPVASLVGVRLVPDGDGPTVEATVPQDDADEVATTVRDQAATLVLRCVQPPLGAPCAIDVARRG